jgi:hypothetical protein
VAKNLENPRREFPKFLILPNYESHAFFHVHKLCIQVLIKGAPKEKNALEGFMFYTLLYTQFRCHLSHVS